MFSDAWLFHPRSSCSSASDTWHFVSWKSQIVDGKCSNSARNYTDSTYKKSVKCDTVARYLCCLPKQSTALLEMVSRPALSFKHSCHSVRYCLIKGDCSKRLSLSDALMSTPIFCGSWHLVRGYWRNGDCLRATGSSQYNSQS